MLGTEQRDWLLEELATTNGALERARQQTAFAPFDNDPAVARAASGPGDNWDGYVAERQQLLDWMVATRTPNPIVITGDSHNNWVRNVPPDHINLDAPPVATEFMGTSISTGGDETVFDPVPGDPEPAHPDAQQQPRLRALHADARGVDERVPKVDTVRQPSSPCSSLATFAVENAPSRRARLGVWPRRGLREDGRVPSPDATRLAVLIDSDNTTAGLTTELLEELAKYGTPTIKRAYGDWTTTQLSGWKKELLATRSSPSSSSPTPRARTRRTPR